jgi:hypothetical protein
VRLVSVREHKTAVDGATEVHHRLDRQYPEAEHIRLVCDHLNTQGIGSLSAAFPPEQARALASRREIHETPKHGRWLNSAEIARSALTLQCLDRRMPDMETLRAETTPWETRRNVSQKGVDWPFSTPDASMKLTRLYPQIQS